MICIAAQDYAKSWRFWSMVCGMSAEEKPGVRTLRKTNPVLLLALLATSAVLRPAVHGQTAAIRVPAGDWRSYAGDLRNHHYSPLDRITAANFNTLEVAWRFKTDFLGPRPEYKLEGTPLAVNGMLYTTAGTRRAVVALDGRTGELRWMHAE